MLRHFAIATLLLSRLAIPAWSQSPSTTPSPATPTAKKPAPKTKAAVKPAAAAESGPCQIGVIPAIGDKFLLEHIGLTVFGNEFTDAPIESWGLDDLVRRDGWVGDSIVGAANPAAAPVLEEIRRRAPLDPRGDHPVAQVLRTGRPMVWRDLTSPDVMQTVVQNEEHRRLIEEARYQSAAVAPLVARGSTLGALSFLHVSTDLRYDADDLQLLGELADRAALALDNARLYEERDRIAQNLQRGLRPPEPPYVPGLDVSVIFDPYGEVMEIGCDLYDFLPPDDGCWIMIGSSNIWAA